MSTTLLFPAGVPESLARMRELREQGEQVLGASSLVNDPAMSLYPRWDHLPYITDDTFAERFVALLAKHEVRTVFTRHPVIGRYLKSIIAERNLPVFLDSRGFAQASIDEQALIFARVDKALKEPFLLDIKHEKPPLSRLQMAALLQHSLRMEGQSSDEKILAMMEIFRSCPPGDIVEIGSFWGRSAYLLTQLSTYFGIGQLLCLDPWENAQAHQEGVPKHLNDEAADIDFTSAFQGFILNLMPFANGRVNYLRGDAHVLHTQYKPGFSVTSEAFGTTRYEGRIACLHIDGNHDHAHVTNDIADWMPHMLPGGWAIIDDYQWTFGDGPRVAADLWVEKNIGKVDRAFVTGSALFVKLGI